MKRILAAVAAVVTVMFVAAPAAFAHTKAPRTLPRIDAGQPIFLQVDQNLCLNAHGPDNQLTVNDKRNGCTNWHATAASQMQDGGGNCMRENNSFQITVVSDCDSTDPSQIFFGGGCGNDCIQLINGYHNNYVSTTGDAPGLKVWGGFSPPNHIDWHCFCRP